MKSIQAYSSSNFVLPSHQLSAIKGGDGDPKPKVTKVIIVKKPD